MNRKRGSSNNKKEGEKKEICINERKKTKNMKGRKNKKRSQKKRDRKRKRERDIKREIETTPHSTNKKKK
jgi:hypothetical protein